MKLIPFTLLLSAHTHVLTCHLATHVKTSYSTGQSLRMFTGLGQTALAEQGFLHIVIETLLFQKPLRTRSVTPINSGIDWAELQK